MKSKKIVALVMSAAMVVGAASIPLSAAIIYVCEAPKSLQ